MGKAVCSQTPSSSAIPCSRTSLVTVFLGLLDLQGGEFKERLKKKVKELRKMQREVIKLCILSLSCTKEEQKDSQAYKTKKKKTTDQNQTKTKQTEKEQRLWLIGIHDWGKISLTRKMSCQDTAGVEREQCWKKNWQAGLQGNIHGELYATWSYSLLDGFSLRGQKQWS